MTTIGWYLEDHPNSKLKKDTSWPGSSSISYQAHCIHELGCFTRHICQLFIQGIYIYIYICKCVAWYVYIYTYRNHIILECGVQQYIQCVYLHMYIIYIWVHLSMPTKCNFYVIHTSYHPSFWRSQSDWLFRARSARSLLIQALQAFVGSFPYGLTTSKWPFDVGKMMKIITWQMEWDNICSDKPSVVVKKWKNMWM